MSARDYDVVLYGASGFTGRQTVEYFARHAPADRVRWAIAGRDRAKLEAVRAEVGAPARPDDVLVADGRDQEAVDALAARARVVLTTAGPFALYGTPLVDACVRHGTHYADITGETPWVRQLINRHHEPAAAAGTRIIPFCGFDSVPSDLGALLVARHMRDSLGVACSEVRAYFRLFGGFNGGTIATVLNMAESGALREQGGRFMLDPPDVAHDRRQAERSRDVTAPRHDAEVGAWVGPFLMAPTNTRVVRRSAALHAQWGEPYGPSFAYQEYQKYRPPLAPLKAAVATAALALFAGAILWAPTRQVLRRLLPKPGTGPSRKVIEQGWFTCELLGRAEDGRRVRGVIRHKGDPGNSATVRFVCESALALALDFDRLPGGPRRGGVLTPATGLGDVLVERLRAAGVQLDVGV